MTYVRWFGVFFGLLSVAIQPSYPDSTTHRNAWFLVGLLALGSVAVWGVNGRAGREREHRRLGFIAFAFDSFIIFGLVWIFAFEDPYVTWALLFIIPMEAALRYQLRGALAAAAGVAGMFAILSFHRAAVVDGSFDGSMYVFVVCLATLIAGISGAMANQWQAQSRALQQQSLKLAEVDRLKDRFLAITSHEIRGPLTAIIAGTDTVRTRMDRMTVEQRDRLLEMVAGQGRQLARLVDDLLFTTQMQSGQLALHPEWIALEDVIQGALDAAASKRRQHQLEVFIEPIESELDGSRLGQIVRNLVENAYKYTPARTRVSVTVKRKDDGVLIEVADEGRGIPADKRETLFAAFSRIEETSAGQEGVGLGLYVVSQLVAAMEGRIDLASSARGTTFTIHLPAPTKPLQVEPHLGLVPDSEEGESSAQA